MSSGGAKWHPSCSSRGFGRTDSQLRLPTRKCTMYSTVTRTGTFLALAAFLTAGATGCASLNKTQKGAIIGAAGGAAAGAVVGKYAGSTTKGAIVGAVVGGAAGAV